MQPYMELPNHSSDEGITDGLKIVSYALNSKGEYELTPDFVWPPVNVANHLAWLEIAKQITQSREKVAAGRVSCLHYYMIANQMDIGLLAKYTSQPRWKVFLHLVPFIFNKLPASTLKKYAQLYKIATDDLIQGRLRPPIYKPE